MVEGVVEFRGELVQGAGVFLFCSGRQVVEYLTEVLHQGGSVDYLLLEMGNVVFLLGGSQVEVE